MRFEPSSFEKNEDKKEMSVQHRQTKLKGGTEVGWKRRSLSYRRHKVYVETAENRRRVNKAEDWPQKETELDATSF